jgi:alkanesulfonate monooxygenase SsuD/methylene tetrahydromethanopterin reductase-like flavin-dependent oxidoreductase (luciferase family)
MRDSGEIPIWLGGSGEKAFDRAARLVDGFIFFGQGGSDGAVESWKSMRERLTNLARSVEDFGAEYVTVSQGVENLTTEVESWRAAGGTHIAISTTGCGFDSIDAHIDYITSVKSTLSGS